MRALLIAMLLTLAGVDAAAGCPCRFDPWNYAANEAQLVENVEQTVQAIAQTALQTQIRDSLGRSGPMAGPGAAVAPGVSGARAAASMAADNFLRNSLVSSIFSTVPGLSSPFGGLDGLLFSSGGRYGSFDVGDILSLIGLDLGSSEVGQAVPMALSLMNQRVGQSGPWGRSMIPRYGFLDIKPPRGVDTFMTLPTSLAFSRQAFQRPALDMSAQGGFERLRVIDARRRREAEEAALSGHGISTHGLAAVGQVNRRVQALRQAAAAAEDLRGQVAVLQETMLALIEEISGLRGIAAAQLRVDSGRSLAGMPVSSSTTGVSIPGVPLFDQ